MLTLPLNTWLLSSQNCSSFLSQMTKGKSLRSHHLFIIGRASILILILIIIIIITRPSSASSSSKASREGEGDGDTAKPPMRACHHAIQLTRVLTWYNSVESVSRRASMCLSYAMTASSVTLPLEEEGAEVDGMERIGGVVVVLVCGRFGWSWASLYWTDAMLMALMTVKWEDSG